MFDIAEFLFENRAKNVEPHWLADVLGKLVWRESDNGDAIHKTLQLWLERGDAERAEVALAYDEGFLFGSLTEFEEAVRRLEERLPHLSFSINNARSHWRHAFPQGYPMSASDSKRIA